MCECSLQLSSGDHGAPSSRQIRDRTCSQLFEVELLLVQLSLQQSSGSGLQLGIGHLPLQVFIVAAKRDDLVLEVEQLTLKCQELSFQ